MAPDTGHFVAAIYNQGCIVRHNNRGGRVSPSSPIAKKRREAIEQLGLVVRSAFNASGDFEPLLTALVDALAPRDDWPRF